MNEELEKEWNALQQEFKQMTDSTRAAVERRFQQFVIRVRSFIKAKLSKAGPPQMGRTPNPPTPTSPPPSAPTPTRPTGSKPHGRPADE